MNADGHLTLELNDDSYNDDYQVFDEWMENACEHPWMAYASERISNWSGYRYFQQALADIGWSNFPMLHAELPDLNGGYMSADKAVIVLEELAKFRQLANGREMPFLVNTHTGNVIHDYVQAYRGIFMWAKPYNFGFDPRGFFIYAPVDDPKTEALKQHIDEEHVVFRSMRFEQRILQEKDGDTPYTVEYFDADNEDRFVCQTPISTYVLHAETGKLEPSHPQIIHVETRKVDASDYYAVGALERICQASVETGNPVIWC